MEFIHPDFPRIAVNPEICFGKPRIKGTRMPITSILSYIAAGVSIEEFLTDFDWLTREDVLEAMAFASVMMQDKFVSLEKSS
jgi:uncharacterized protein (DUF433 family)